jgi:hypothetical protein
LGRPKWILVIGTAGSEVAAIWSHDHNFIVQAVGAVNEAVVYRG